MSPLEGNPSDPAEDGVAQRARPQGVLVVDKPRGPTSHDIVARVRRALKTREVGHAGTLDPMATGVLVVAIGEATKLVAYLTAQDKAYRATLRLGVATRSLDAEGEVTEQRPLDAATVALLAAVERGDARSEGDALSRAIEVERARTAQQPPEVSAIRVDGQRAHALMRRGEAVVLEPRAVAVRALAVTAARAAAGELDLEVACAKGYYVRALARDLAASLGTLGHLVALRRTQSGPFTLDEAVDGDRLDEASIAAKLLPVAAAAARVLPVATLVDDGVTRARHGKLLTRDDFAAEPPAATSIWLDARGAVVAIGAWDGAQGKVVRGLR